VGIGVRSISEGIQQQRYKCLVESFRCLFEPGSHLPVPFERQAAELGLGRVAQYPYCGTSTDLPVPFERQAAELGLGQVAREDGFLEPEAQVDLVLGQVGLHLLF